MTPLLRCYLPLSPADLQHLHGTRRVPDPAVAFTARGAIVVSEDGEDGEDEEAGEYAALQAAARYALTRGGPVIVAAADVEQAAVERPSDVGATSGAPVRVTREVTLPRIASLHVGDDVLGLPLTDVTDDEDIELSWYDTTEVAHLVALL